MTSSSVAPQATSKPAQDQKRRALLEPRLLGSPARWIALVVGLIVLLAFFFTASDRWMIVVNYALIAALAALALNVLSGYAGQISLGIAFFMAIGAYTAAFLGGEPPSSPTAPLGLGLSFVIWLPAAGIVAALIGALVGPTALRLKGFYLGIVSLGLVFIGLHLFKNVRAFTAISGGAKGRGFPAPAIGDFSFGQQNDIGFGSALPHQDTFFSRSGPGGMRLSRQCNAFTGWPGGCRPCATTRRAAMRVSTSSRRRWRIHPLRLPRGSRRGALCVICALCPARLLGSGALDPVRRRDHHRRRRQCLGLDSRSRVCLCPSASDRRALAAAAKLQ